MQMTVLGTSRRASLVSSAASRRTPPGSGTARRRNVSSCSSLSPSRFSSSSSSSPRGKRLLDGVEVGIERTLRRSGVDVDHGRDLLGDAVARAVAGGPGPAVHGEHDGSPRRPDRLADRVDVVRHGDGGAVGVSRLETGQRQRGDVVAVGTQRGGDLVPRPRAEPEPRNQDNRCASHSSTLAALSPSRARKSASASQTRRVGEPAREVRDEVRLPPTLQEK